MDVDEDVFPILTKMDELMAEIQSELLPSVKALSEDIVATQFSVEEQARMSIAAAFAILMATYCRRRFLNEPIEAPLTQRIEKIGEYIKKVRATDSSIKGKKHLSVADRGGKKVNVQYVENMIKNAQSINKAKQTTD